MNISKSKIVAIVTGIFSIFICVLYLLLITVFDFRSLLNDQITSLPEILEAIFVDFE